MMSPVATKGSHNELAAFGYNRDGKKGKRQIVIGLLCDEDGHPVSIKVFPGNTQNPQTFAAQINKVKVSLVSTRSPSWAIGA